MNKTITCIECPMGCEITVLINENKEMKIEGNGCQRGAKYAGEEVLCPKRILTTTVKSNCGKLVSVKTDKGVDKESLLLVMEKIKLIEINLPIKIGDIVKENLVRGVNLVATSSEE